VCLADDSERDTEARPSARDIEARPAAREDLPEIERLLGSRGIAVAPASLAERIDGDACGVILAREGCASWVLDGGALHVYDVVADSAALGPLLDGLECIAAGQFCAAMTASLYADDPLLSRYLEHGFEADWEEADVRAGEPVRVVGLVRQVG
jgi:hypothetical protein